MSGAVAPCVYLNKDIESITGTRRFGLRSTGRKSRRGAALSPGAVHRFAGLFRGHRWCSRLAGARSCCARIRQRAGRRAARGTEGSPLAKTVGIAALYIIWKPLETDWHATPLKTDDVCKTLNKRGVCQSAGEMIVGRKIVHTCSRVSGLAGGTILVPLIRLP